MNDDPGEGWFTCQDFVSSEMHIQFHILEVLLWLASIPVYLVVLVLLFISASSLFRKSLEEKWVRLKMMIVGARLSRLVQKNKSWDHGSMIEEVKTIFFHLYKAKSRGDAQLVKKYLTIQGMEDLKTEIDELIRTGDTILFKNPVVEDVAIIDVTVGKQNKYDVFRAIVKGNLTVVPRSNNEPLNCINSKTLAFKERWTMVRQGDWWLLDNRN